MPKDQAAIERRIFESWRARACAAGLCVGAQIFLFGTGIVMPIALNSTWLCAMISLPFPIFITIASRKKSIIYDSPVSRAALIMLTITLLANAVFASAALISFAEQTLLEQARVLWIALLTVIAVFLCALSGGSGVSWLCFALRWSLPVLIGGFLEASYPSSTTMLVLCVMPTAIMQLKVRITNLIASRIVTITITLFSAFMVIGRFLSGVHWFSDIIGGALLSTSLVLFYRYFSYNK